VNPVAGTGVWAAQLRYGDATAIAETAAELEELGYSALWIPDDGGDVFASVELLMASTRRTAASTFASRMSRATARKHGDD
jgi:hypothetical protein